MAISQFERFQFYDEVIAFGIQSAYGSAASPSIYLLVNAFEFTPENMEITTRGTSTTRGILEDQAVKSGRLGSFSLQIDLMNTAAVKSVIQWCLGTNAAPTNAVTFATLGLRSTGGVGTTIADCAITRLDIVIAQNQTIKLVAYGTVFGDWDIASPVASGTPAGGTKLLIEDTSFTIHSTELPVELGVISIVQDVSPVFANNAFPVSFEVGAYRSVTAAFDLPPTDTTYALISGLRDDDVGDIVVDIDSEVILTLQQARYLVAGGKDFTGIGVSPVTASFRAHQPDTATAELGITYG